MQMQITDRISRLYPQQEDNTKLTDALNNFISQVTNVVNCPLTSPQALVPPVDSPTTQNLPNHASAVASNKPAVQFVEHLHNRLFNRLYSKNRSESEKPLGQAEAPVAETAQTPLAYLTEQKNELEKARSELDKNYGEYHEALKRAQGNWFKRIIAKIFHSDKAADLQANRIAAKEWYVAQCSVLDKAIAKLAVQLEQNDLTEQQLSAELTEEYRLALQDYVIPDDISQDETVVEDDAGWQDLRDDENFSTELAIDTMVFNNNPSEDAVENKESIAEMPTMELPAFNKENYTLTQVEAELEYDGVSQPTDEQRAALYQPTDEKRAALYDEPYK